MRQQLDLFLGDEGGATSIEYALIGAMIAVIAIGGFTYFGQSVSGKFQFISDTVNNATAS